MRTGPGPLGDINLVPLGVGDSPLSWHQAVQNLILTIPFGFGVVFVTRLAPRVALIASLGFGAVIETLQVMLNVAYGFPYRTIDINDVIFNAIGALFGVTLFLLASRFYRGAFGRTAGRSRWLRHMRSVLASGGSRTTSPAVSVGEPHLARRPSTDG